MLNPRLGIYPTIHRVQYSPFNFRDLMTVSFPSSRSEITIQTECYIVNIEEKRCEVNTRS